MATVSKTTKFVLFILFNVILIILLYNIEINSEILNNICIYKHITGKPCWNCGMTRAFLSVIHFDFESAYKFNRNVIIVFPLTIVIYIYSWYVFIFKKGEKKSERKN